MSEVLRSQFDGGVARFIMAGADTGNILSRDLLADLKEALTQAGMDETCRVIVISAVGRSFCAGMDLDLFLEDRLPDPEYFRLFADCLKLVCRSSRPVVAGVQGETLGGGVGLVAACDWVVATKDASFMLPEVVAGMIPAVITPFLGRRLSPARIRGLTVCSKRVDSTEAKMIGLVDEVADSGLEGAVEQWVGRILRSSPEALTASKTYFDRLFAGDFDQQVDTALDAVMSWLECPGVVEGIRCFSEGYTPPWFGTMKVNKEV